MSNKNEVATDMDAAWQSAKAMQQDNGYKNGMRVVIQGDKYTFWLTEVNLAKNKGRIVRQGLVEEGEEVWVSLDIDLADVVELRIMTHAMFLHTNRIVHIKGDSDPLTSFLPDQI